MVAFRIDFPFPTLRHLRGWFNPQRAVFGGFFVGPSEARQFGQRAYQIAGAISGRPPRCGYFCSLHCSAPAGKPERAARVAATMTGNLVLHMSDRAQFAQRAIDAATHVIAEI